MNWKKTWLIQSEMSWENHSTLPWSTCSVVGFISNWNNRICRFRGKLCAIGHDSTEYSTEGLCSQHLCHQCSCGQSYWLYCQHATCIRNYYFGGKHWSTLLSVRMSHKSNLEVGMYSMNKVSPGAMRQSEDNFHHYVRVTMLFFV